MTRETKLGLGIASTFLLIAGSWVGVKLYRGEPAAPEEPTAEVAAENAEPKPQALVDAGGAAQPAEPKSEPVVETKTQPVRDATPQPVADAKPQPVAPTAPVVENPTAAEVKSEAQAVAPSTAASPPPPSIPAPVIAAPVISDPPPPVVPTPMGDPVTPIVAPIVAPIPEQPASVPVTTPAPAPAPKPADAPVAPAPVVDPPPPAVVPTPAPVVETKKDPEPSPSTIIITKPADAPTPPAPAVEPSVVLVPATPAGVASLGPPGGAANPPREPFSTANNARSPTEPRVQSYLEEEYRWQPGDGFAMLSQKFYNSDKYAAALQQYNREYPLASTNMKQNPPSIVPGQVIWVPPVCILERDYATMIAGVQPLTDRGMPATNAVRPVENTVTANATQLYRVRERGETMYEIARRTLNDSGQWFQIHRLNPTLSRDPRFPIPAATVLKLPGEAKLEAADKPQ